MGYAIDFGATTAYVETGASTSAIGTASHLAMKAAVRGQVLINAGLAFDTRYVADIGGTTDAAHRLGIFAYGGDDPNIAISAYIGAIGDGLSWSTSSTLLRTSVVAGDYYVFYADHAASGSSGFVGLGKDGAQLLGSTAAANGAMPSASGNGLVRVGARLATTTNGIADRVDGIAVYSAALSGADRWSIPTASDPNLLGFWPFDEGTGTTTANAVGGGEAMSVWSGGITWVEEGTWNGFSPGVASLTSITAQEVTASATDSVGGTAPISYQWQRSPTGAGDWSDVTGQTTRTMSDTSMVPGVTYYWRLRYTDNNGVALYSNTVSGFVPRLSIRPQGTLPATLRMRHAASR